MVELVDALDSKSSGGNPVTVRVRPSAPVISTEKGDISIVTGASFFGRTLMCCVVEENIDCKRRTVTSKNNGETSHLGFFRKHF